MIDFKIRRGPSELLFTAPGVVNPQLVIEEGYWYLSTDTAELFLGVQDETTESLTLKRINGLTALDTCKNINAYTDINYLNNLDYQALIQLQANVVKVEDGLTLEQN